jgi:hypothetical protein
MEIYVNYTVSLINLFILVTYSWMLYKRKISPSLAMWTFFSIAVAMSLITYLAKDSYSLADNILNATDLVLVVLVSVAILIFGDRSTKFNTFDLGCLVAVILIVGFWFYSSNHLVTHISIQAILVVAYFPVVKRMIQSKRNTEPFSVWIALLLAPIISLFSSEGILASIYTYRAIACTSLLLILMIRIELINRKVATE